MPTIRVPTALRTLTGGAADIEIEAATVREALVELDRLHPGLAMKLLDAAGSVKPFIRIYVGPEDIQALHGLDTKLVERDEIADHPRDRRRPAMRDEQIQRYARHVILPDIGPLGQTALLVAAAKLPLRESEPRAEMIAARVSRGRRRRHARRARRDRRAARGARAHGPDTRGRRPTATRREVALAPRPAWWPRRRRRRGRARVLARRDRGDRYGWPTRRRADRPPTLLARGLRARTRRRFRPSAAATSTERRRVVPRARTSMRARTTPLRDRRRRAARVRPQLRRPRAGAHPLSLAHQRPRLHLGDRPRAQAGGVPGAAPRRRRHGRRHRRGGAVRRAASSSWPGGARVSGRCPSSTSLRETLAGYGQVVVAFSGGVDSAFLLRGRGRRARRARATR